MQPNMRALWPSSQAYSGCPPHNRRGQQSFSARMIAFDVAKFFWPLDEAPLSALLFIRCLRVGRQSLDSFRG